MLAAGLALVACTAAGAPSPTPAATTPTGQTTPGQTPNKTNGETASETASQSPTSSGSASPTPAPSPAQSDGTLQILAYRGYAEYGSSGGKVNWVGAFEKTTGCRIAKLDTVQTPDELDAKLAERAYDVISVGPDAAPRLIQAKQVQPIDTAKVTGYDDLIKRFRDMSQQGGKTYGVPYLWGSHEVLYDSSKVKGDRAKQLYQSDRAALQDTPMSIAGAALAAEQELDVTDPYELTPSQLDATMRMLEQHKDRFYWKYPIDLIKGFATGSLDYAQATPYYRLLLQKAGKPIKAIKTEQTTGWMDQWMLGANVPNIDCAYRWLSWMAMPETQRAAAAWVGLAPTNPKACKGKAKRICEAYGVGKPERLARVVFAVRPPGDCRAQDRECTDYATWTTRWRGLVN